jgi:hypothetical protein
MEHTLGLGGGQGACKHALGYESCVGSGRDASSIGCEARLPGCAGPFLQAHGILVGSWITCSAAAAAADLF